MEIKIIDCILERSKLLVLSCIVIQKHDFVDHVLEEKKVGTLY